MVKTTKKAQRSVGKGVLSVVLTGALTFGCVGTAFAADAPFGNTPSGDAQASSQMLRSYGVRAGSAGADFVGVTNTNYDFTGGKASSPDQYTGYTEASSAQLAGLSIWGTDVNENANPYYSNLLYHAIKGETASGAEATTWMSNPETSAWGDSNCNIETDELNSTNAATGEPTIAGLEYSPQIIFGANKSTNWNLNSNGSNSDTNMYRYLSANNQTATFVNNDATNLWSQIYTISNLAQTATGLAGTTRYDANQSAIDYERATKGQMLYVASQIDAGKVAKKKVAYLYAIDEDGTGYFFTPKAEGLLNGNDTNQTTTSKVETADTNYAANNSTINMGYMATLPFITDTYDSGNATNVVMKVEDIYKASPACTVGASDSLKDVDVIIFNTTKNTDLQGTSGGKNESGINNAAALNANYVQKWAAEHGFTGSQIIGGDDWGTSSNQQSDIETAPKLYCQRNYTADKDTRAAWGFSKVYPELYNNNSNATYGYWANNIYHVKTASVPAVVNYMTNQTNAAYDENVAQMVETNAETGYNWWVNTGSKKAAWSKYAYYTGSSRASYYSGDKAAEETASTIGIFEPTNLWKNASHPAATTTAAKTSLSKATVTVAASKTYTGKAIKPSVKVTLNGKTVAASSYTITYKNNKKVGKATVTVTGKGNYTDSKSATFKINPKGTSVKSVSKAKKSFTAKWNKQSTQTTGYQVRYATNKSMKNAKTKTVKSTKTTSLKVSNLKSGKKYYVQVRTYKTVNGTKYYSSWSSAKTVTTK